MKHFVGLETEHFKEENQFWRSEQRAKGTR